MTTRIRIFKKSGTVWVDELKIENAIWNIKDGVFSVIGDGVDSKFSFDRITDPKELDEIRPEFYKEGGYVKKYKYVSGWYHLKKTRLVTVRVTNFLLVETDE